MINFVAKTVDNATQQPSSLCLSQRSIPLPIGKNNTTYYVASYKEWIPVTGTGMTWVAYSEKFLSVITRLSVGRMIAATFAFSLLATTSTHSADKLEVLDSYFFAQLASDEKNELRTKTTRIPNIPDKICFGWVINVTPSDELAKITEIFTLPQAPKVWGGVEDDPYSQTTTTQDRKTATTNRFASLKKGKLENSWCLTKGDPSGDHHIVVLYGTQVLAEFEFVVYE